MCVVCGCNTDLAPGHAHVSAIASPPGVEPGDAPPAALHYGAGAAKMSVPGMSPARAIRLEADVLGANNRLAARNRAHFAAHGVTAINLLSSPGSGKTSLLCASIAALHAHWPGVRLAVIEGDQQTSLDAERIRAAGAPAIQVNTGRGCHLDAQMVGDAFDRLDLHGHGHHPHPDHHAVHNHDHDHHGDDHAGPALLFIENVGNLVCPALWDLGEAAKVVILSVTEGDDKPLKYPDMFAAATLMLVNKIDLLPHVQFDVAKCIANARRVNPGIEVLQVSATRGDGIDAWLAWLLPERDADPHPTPPHEAAAGVATAPDHGASAPTRRVGAPQPP